MPQATGKDNFRIGNKRLLFAFGFPYFLFYRTQYLCKWTQEISVEIKKATGS